MKRYAYGWLWCNGSRVITWNYRIGRCWCSSCKWYKTRWNTIAIFSSGVAGFLEMLGVPNDVATVFMTMCVSALALTSLDSVARIGRMSFQELFYEDTTDPAKWVVSAKY